MYLSRFNGSQVKFCMSQNILYLMFFNLPFSLHAMKHYWQLVDAVVSHFV